MPRPRTLIIPGIAVAVHYSTPTETTDVRPPIEQPIQIDSGDADNAAWLGTDALAGTGLSVPEGWVVVDVRNERHDDREVTVIRHQPAGHVLGGPHSSIVLAVAGTVLGYTRLAEQEGDALPDESASEQIALDFIRQTAPDYVDGLSASWIDQHDETVTLSDGTTATVSGMKVKMHHDNGPLRAGHRRP